MSLIEVVFVNNKDSKLDECLHIYKTSDGYTMIHRYAHGPKDVLKTNQRKNLSSEDVFTTIVNSLTLATMDDLPYDGVQVSFPMSPITFLKLETLQKDDVWNTVLSTFEYWLNQSSWSSKSTNQEESSQTEKIDLSKSNLNVAVNTHTNTRNITVPLNTHMFFNEDSDEDSYMYTMY